MSNKKFVATVQFGQQIFCTIETDDPTTIITGAIDAQGENVLSGVVVNMVKVKSPDTAPQLHSHGDNCRNATTLCPKCFYAFQEWQKNQQNLKNE